MPTCGFAKKGQELFCRVEWFLGGGLVCCGCCWWWDVGIVEEDSAVFTCYFEAFESESVAVDIACDVFYLFQAVVLS